MTKKGGWNNAPDYTPQGPFWPVFLITFLILGSCAAITISAMK